MHLLNTFIGAVLACLICAEGLNKQQEARHHLSSFLQKAVVNQNRSSSLLKLHPYYHTSEGIHQEIAALSSRCPGMTVETKKAGAQSIDVVTIRLPDTSPRNKNFMLFGEHPRELISAESSLHFIKKLCGDEGDKDRAMQVLQDSEFQIVVNGNPEARKGVEQGDFCLRANPNGVDLNRNWDEKWQPAEGANAFAFMSQTDPGSKPFSEAETRLFRDLVSSYKPTTFLSIHSGTKGMYMPWAYTDQLATRNQKAMMKVLKDVDSNHCQCPFGANGREVGYTSAGTSVDWVYDKLQTPYAFTFEIYGDPAFDEELKESWKQKLEDLQSFTQTAKAPRRKESQLQQSMSDDDCFSSFNPDSEERYHKTVENWSEAYLDMAHLIAQDLKNTQAEKA